ncbi:MAG: hypothetical protein IT207_10340 [Fimbriimonadaceae bacterium]|nr:hypothetical protein [Fimbriimonadaceae bacterium]
MSSAPQQRVTSEQQAIAIADAFREFAILGSLGANVGDELKPVAEVALDEDTSRYRVSYPDGYAYVRVGDARVSAFMLEDDRHCSRSMKEEVSEQAIARAQAKVVRAFAFLGYKDMTAVFGKTTVGSGSMALNVSFRPVWRGIEYPGTEWRHATFDPEGERLLRFTLTGLSRPPEDTTVTIEEADAETSMRLKLVQVYGDGPWERTRMKPVIFRLRPVRKPHISAMHSWGWEIGPPSVVAWEGAFVNPAMPQLPTDPPWKVHVWLDAKTGHVLEMLSVTNRSSSTWRPPP